MKMHSFRPAPSDSTTTESGTIGEVTAKTAVLFDVDGTLVDSNYLHIQAWSEALQAVDFPVDDARIHRAIGMDSSKLLDTLLGSQVATVGNKAKSVHSKRYKKLTSRLRPFQSAKDLLKAVHDHGVLGVLATSAPPDELAELRKVLDAEEFISLATNADDVETAKPEPDLLHVALDKAGVTANNAVMLGDTVWDGVAAAKAGITFVAVRSGGISAAELREAGAVEVYDDVSHLLRELSSSPLRSLFNDG